MIGLDIDHLDILNLRFKKQEVLIRIERAYIRKDSIDVIHK